MSRTFNGILVGLLVLFLAGCSDYIPSGIDGSDDGSIVLLKAGDKIPNRYIVVMDDNFTGGLPDAASDIARTHAGTVGHVYGTALKGFSISMSSSQANRLRADSRVKLVEQDRVVALAPPPGKGKPPKDTTGGEEDPPPPPSQTTPWGIPYVGSPGGDFSSETVTVWIIDSGIDLDHPDLNVDVARSVNFASKGKNTPEDGHGHGTHVAGTVGAKDNSFGVVGVAPGVTVVAVRVLGNNGSGSYSGVIAGVNHVAANGTSGDVANMSLGGPASSALDQAIVNAAANGIRFALAAGNDGANASTKSPARVNAPNVYTVSAHNTSGCLTSWSNYGLGVDYAAPGASILSTYKGGAYATMSGTSMACPHVAGLLALNSLNSNGIVCNDSDASPDPKAHY